jgi:hypothetical protein
VGHSDGDIISRVEVRKNKVTVHRGPCLKGLLRRTFSVEYDAAIDLGELDESILITPYLLNIVPALWILGQTFVVDSMDEDLFDSLESVKRGFQTLYPDVPWQGRLVPRRLVKNPRREGSAPPSQVLFYSGGVDSTYSALHRDPKETVLLTVQGHDISLGNEDGWRTVCGRAEEFARGFGFTTARVRANVIDLLRPSGTPDGHPGLKPWYGKVQHGLGLSGLGFPLAAYHGWKNIVFSSFASPDGEPFQWGSHLLLEPELVVNGINVVSIGESTHWVDKILAISNIYRERRSKRYPLRVCTDSTLGDPVENCCSCEKCLRGIVALLARFKSPDAWGFCVPEPVHETVKKRLMSVQIPAYNLYHWRRLQEVAVSSLGEADGESREFLSWFSTWDFEKNVSGRRSQTLPGSRRTFQRAFGRLFGP